MTKRIQLRPRDPQLWEDLDDFLLEKYGTKHTVLTAYVERGLYLVLAELKVPGYENVSTNLNSGDLEGVHTHKNLPPRKRRLLESFIKAFGRLDKVSHDDLVFFISNEMNVSDKRAVWNHINFLKSKKWIFRKPRKTRWTIMIPPSALEEFGVECFEVVD